MKKKTLKELTIEKYKGIKEFEDHKMPTSRRDFLKLGMLAGGGLLLNPFDSVAHAQSSTRIPFLTFDLAGGASLPGNFLVGKQGGPEDLAKEYEGNGWDPRVSGALDHRFGLPMSAKESGILRGLLESLPAELLVEGQTAFKMASHLHFSLDDQSTNKTSALSYVAKSGLEGSVFGGSLGNRTTLSGGNSRGLLENSQYKPKAIQGINDILTLTSFGRNFDRMGTSGQDRFRQILSQQGNGQLSEYYAQLKNFGKPHNIGDPRNDELARRLFNFNSESEVVEAAIMLNVIKKYTGPGVITVEDCDYHDGSRDRGDQRDFEIGLKIGKAVHLAHLNNTPLFFQIITDGGMSASSFERNWQSDSPLRSMAIMGYYNPNTKVELVKQQIGHVVDNSETNITNEVSKSADKAALSALVNYLFVNNDMAALERVYGRMSKQEVDELLVFG